MQTTPVQKTATVLAAAVALTIAVPAQANIFGPQEVKRWDMCECREMPSDVLERIMLRSDFDDILRRMFEACPEAALWLTDRPTASLGDFAGFRSNRGREPDSGSGRVAGPSVDRETEDRDGPLGGPGTPDTPAAAPEAPDAPDLGLPG